MPSNLFEPENPCSKITTRLNCRINDTQGIMNQDRASFVAEIKAALDTQL